MKFVCPVCKTAGELTQDVLEQKVTKTICRKCAAILIINPDSGKVETHKSSLKDSPVLGNAGIRENDGAPSVLSMRPEKEETRDWIAIGVIIVVLIMLISAGVYFVINLDLNIILRPL
jgi:hypothetical protein